jgi:g-D-glutamyl-meso-diaminopimelate peptidase
MPNNFVYSAAYFAQEIRSLGAQFPELRVSVYGYSDMGKPLYALYLGNGARRVIMSAAFHANEWLTAAVMLRYIRSVCESSDYEGRSLCFAPLVNPDAMDLVTGALTAGPSFRQSRAIADNYPLIRFPDGWKANIRGVDLNLQFPAGWELAKTIKYAQGFTSPAPRDFVGYYPLSEPESRGIAELTEQFLPDTAVSLHSQGEVIYWQFRGSAPEGARQLGEKMAAAGDYTLAETPPESDNAGYKDWVIYRLGVPAFTVEMGLGQNPLPVSELDSLSNRVIPILQAASDGV